MIPFLKLDCLMMYLFHTVPLKLDSEKRRLHRYTDNTNCALVVEGTEWGIVSHGLL